MRSNGLTLAVGGERVTGLNVLSGQVREVFKYLMFGHSGRQVAEDVVNRNTHSPDTRLSTSLSWFNSYDVSVVHEPTLVFSSQFSKVSYLNRCISI